MARIVSESSPSAARAGRRGVGARAARRTILGMLLLSSAAWIASAMLPAQDSGPARQTPKFEADVRPLLQAKCWRCHGEKEHKGQLDLRTAASTVRGGESGPAIVPGKPDESLLYEKTHAGEMPPEKKDRLSVAEVETIRLWIAGGARSSSTEAAGPESRPVTVTQHDVLPILMRRCTACHGPRRQE